ncbi:uncharacterized protein M421DRAFT_283438 [Didymella exigua CBS 183.55]|uniref:Secreted protein n=1 Tax=Didymella exigua CBS 183.55 TaxID=1150837 RepID=A0A6A5RW11_9PLEO|nr:uncharacterized protein M421DRAFT_283438 [Didymella exigua CBS 183.55]KAF1932052.1 hypothetical protein M421DRAFT_283438 [Didymella exigua CBS 183.55]
MRLRCSRALLAVQLSWCSTANVPWLLYVPVAHVYRIPSSELACFKLGAAPVLFTCSLPAISRRRYSTRALEMCLGRQQLTTHGVPPAILSACQKCSLVV